MDLRDLRVWPKYFESQSLHFISHIPEFLEIIQFFFRIAYNFCEGV